MSNSIKQKSISDKTQLPMKHVEKGWGWERWIVNCEEYCGKLLFFKKDKRCSWHHHELKDEVFYLQSGLMIVKFSESGTIDSDGRIFSLTIISDENHNFPYVFIMKTHPGQQLLAHV